MERQKKTRRMTVVRPAFTLVELLVVITIIGMLMALLIPAISIAKEQGRRMSCMNNQHQLGVALTSYENSHKSFPGWRNYVKTSGGQITVSWLTMLLQNLDAPICGRSSQPGATIRGPP